jgi:hypothetical protein
MMTLMSMGLTFSSLEPPPFSSLSRMHERLLQLSNPLSSLFRFVLFRSATLSSNVHRMHLLCWVFFWRSSKEEKMIVQQEE